MHGAPCVAVITVLTTKGHSPAVGSEDAAPAAECRSGSVGSGTGVILKGFCRRPNS